MRGPEEDAAARLLERLLSDQDYRAAFRADPVAASRAAGLESVADEMAAGVGKVMQTLDERESRSSLAGVLMAAALEGGAIVDFSRDVLPHLEDVPRAVGDVLAGLELPGVAEAQAATPTAAGVEPVAGEFPAIRPELVELLQGGRVSFDAEGLADLRAGRIDPRIVSVLQTVARDHRISVSAMRSDHGQFTSGGSVSNHYYGRAVDIAVVDGQPVSPGNAAARELAESLARLPPSIRPTEIGSPWALPGAAYFTDGAHQNHVHVAYDDPVPGGWTPPAAPAGGNAAAELPAVAAPAEDVPAVEDADSPEPGGLEDPGGDTDAEADAESDGDGDDNDSVSDDESDEQENDEESDESDGDDGDHDDSSDSGSEDTSDSDGSDGGEDDGSGAAPGSGPGDSAPGSGPLDFGPGELGGSYPGDNASQAELAGWMAAAAQKRGLPPELPVMAALVESHLSNLDYGDADSVGFFQMRAGIWNQGDYAGYPERPELQLKWFLDQAAAVKRQRLASGRPVDDPNSYGDWIADIERPAVQYRGRYQLQLEEARGLLRSAGRNGGGGAQLEEVADGGGPAGGARALAAVHEARKYLGTPYQWGGSTPQTGFDCSGLMQWAYAKAGIRIPRTTYLQIDAANAKPVARNALQPGDLVFFRNSSGDVHHVGMSLGGDKFIQAPHTGDVVKISSLKEPYYAQEFTGGRRFDQGAAAGVRAAVASAGGDAGQAMPAADQAAVRDAEAALLRDAAEVQQPGTLLFEAVRAQELPKL
jgi:cell wall-associated NlpC family hydrolase